MGISIHVLDWVLGYKFGTGFLYRSLGLDLKGYKFGIGFWDVGLGLEFGIQNCVWVWGCRLRMGIYGIWVRDYGTGLWDKGLQLDFVPKLCGPCGLYVMDFPPEICGPCGPYIAFLPELMDIEVNM